MIIGCLIPDVSVLSLPATHGSALLGSYYKLNASINVPSRHRFVKVIDFMCLSSLPPLCPVRTYRKNDEDVASIAVMHFTFIEKT